MEKPDLERFKLKVREYRLLVNRNQSDLAAYLNLDYNELSNRLNLHKNARLSHENLRAIVRALADWGAITTRSQAEELLDLMLCPHFDEVDWQAKPLSKLAASLFRPKPQKLAPPPLEGYQSLFETGTPASSYPLDSRLTPSHNLVQPISSFIGRQKEVRQLKNLLVEDRQRLVTLVGAGGVGKSRLSQHLGLEVLKYFAGGVWLVELASVNNPALVLRAIAKTFGVVEQPGQEILDSLIKYLRQRPILLLLDNCEHLVEECSRVVEKLITQTQALQILATSREGLGVSGEQSYLMPSLALPLPEQVVPAEKIEEYEALHLFMDRARLSNSEFKLKPGEVTALVEVCQKLDGIPLALELAAARTSVLSLFQIRDRLEDRFRLLRGGNRNSLPRQQTLRAMVEWSYNLLTEPEKRLLDRASVIAGSWTLAAAEKICSGPGLEEPEILEGVNNLVNKSLLGAERLDQEIRYRFLETIRQFGLQKLKESGEEREIRKRHLFYYAGLAGELSPKLWGLEQGETIKLLDRELDNVRAAISFGLELKLSDLIVPLTAGIFLYWDIRNYHLEFQEYQKRALAFPFVNPENRAELLNSIGFTGLRQGDLESVRFYYEQLRLLSVEYPEKKIFKFLKIGLAVLSLSEGKYAEGLEYCKEALALFEELGEAPPLIAAAKDTMARFLVGLERYEEADLLLGEAASIVRETGSPWALTLVLIAQTKLSLFKEEYIKAQHQLEEAWRVSQEIDYLIGKYLVLNYLGVTLYQQNKFQEAGHYFRQSLDFAVKERERIYSFQLLPLFTGIAGLLSKMWLQEKEERFLLPIAMFWGASKNLKAIGGPVLFLTDRLYFEQALEVARINLAEAQFTRAISRGKEMSIEETLAYSRQILAEI